jgi:hypothetical protein
LGISRYAGRASQQRPHINANERRRQNAHRGEHGKAPSHVGRNVYRGNAFGAGDAPQSAHFGIRHKHEVLPSGVFAHGLGERLTHNEVLRHGLHRPTGLGDHQDEGARQVEPCQGGTDRRRVHVVEHVQSWMSVALRGREFIPAGRAQGRAQGNRPQRRTTNAEQQHVVKRAVHLRRDRE